MRSRQRSKTRVDEPAVPLSKTKHPTVEYLDISEPFHSTPTRATSESSIGVTQPRVSLQSVDLFFTFFKDLNVNPVTIKVEKKSHLPSFQKLKPFFFCKYFKLSVVYLLSISKT